MHFFAARSGLLGERRGRTADSKPTDFVGKPKPKPKAKTGKPGKSAPAWPAGKKPTAKKHPARPAKPR